MLELKDVKVESLVPKDLEKINSIESFLEKLSKEDGRYVKLVKKAKKKGNVLRYLAEIKGKNLKVGLKEVPKNSPFGSLQGPDNMIVFKTKRYNENPLVIRGPGAGPEVTAAGVFADVLKIAGSL